MRAMELQRDVRLSVVLPANKRLAQLAAKITGLALPGSEEVKLEDFFGGVNADGTHAAAVSAAAATTAVAGATDSAASTAVAGAIDSTAADAMASTAADAAAQAGNSDVAELDRDFAFPGEQATLFVLVTPRADGCAGQFDQADFASMCRSLEVIIDATDCVVGTVMLCPKQPHGREHWPPGPEDDSTSSEGSSFLSLRKAIGNACATYYFQIAMPESSAEASDGVSGWVDLDLQCRFKSWSVTSLVSRAATGLNLSNQQAIDPMGFASSLPRAQEILHSACDGRDCSHITSDGGGPDSRPGRGIGIGIGLIENALSSQAIQLSKRVRNVQCTAIRSRCLQIGDKAFIEVVFENVHSSLRLELKDITLHTQTTLPVVFSVARIGRWCLPMQLLPGDKQSMCFEVSNFGDSNPVTPHMLAEDEVVGSRFSSMATVMWSSDVTLPYVRMQHAVKWCGFESSCFHPIAARFIKNEQGAVEINCGDTFQINLEVLNRMDKETDLHVLLPIQDLEQILVLPLDTSIHVGKVPINGDPVHVPMHFLALHTGLSDLSEFVCLYDAVSDMVHKLREPSQIAIFPKLR